MAEIGEFDLYCSVWVFALGIVAEILFVPKGKKIAAKSPTPRGKCRFGGTPTYFYKSLVSNDSDRYRDCISVAFTCPDEPHKIRFLFAPSGQRPFASSELPNMPVITHQGYGMLHSARIHA